MYVGVQKQIGGKVHHIDFGISDAFKPSSSKCVEFQIFYITVLFVFQFRYVRHYD